MTDQRGRVDRATVGGGVGGSVTVVSVVAGHSWVASIAQVAITVVSKVVVLDDDWMGMVAGVVSVNVRVGVWSVSEVAQGIGSVSVVGVGTFSNGDGGHHDYSCDALPKWTKVNGGKSTKSRALTFMILF
jgi:hypothetical protein